MEDTLYFIDYPLESGDGHVTVATVRPETMLADTAVAVNPNDERYFHLIGKAAMLPLVGRRLPIIADDYVDPEFGTGALKITPGHDPNDFEIGRRHGLEEISVIGEDGRMTAAAGRAVRRPDRCRRRARRWSRALDELGAISQARAIRPLGRAQPPLGRADRAADLAAVVLPHGRAGGAGDRGGRVRARADRARPIRGSACCSTGCAPCGPWCISRQLWWGHRLPVWYCDRCEETYVAETPPERCGACDGELRQETDVLDTWFSSQLWPFAVLGWPDDTPELRAFYPTDFLTTAREILYLWVARMIMMGLEFAGDVPFDDVYVHSVILAPDGRRMSKSLGTGIDPIEAIEAARRGRAALRPDGDVVEPGRPLFHEAGRAGPRPRQQDVERVAARAAEHRTRSSRRAEPETVEDRWILSRLQRAIGDVTERDRRLRLLARARSSCTRSSGASSATGTWRWSSRACTRAEDEPPCRRRCCTCSRRRSRCCTR